MQILAKCPKCNQHLQLSFDAADRRITCPKCGTLFKVPDLNSLNKALSVVKNTQTSVFVDENGNLYG